MRDIRKPKHLLILVNFSFSYLFYASNTREDTREQAIPPPKEMKPTTANRQYLATFDPPKLVRQQNPRDMPTAQGL